MHLYFGIVLILIGSNAIVTDGIGSNAIVADGSGKIDEANRQLQ